MRFLMVSKLVSMPPSQRWLTKNMLQRSASSRMVSCACFLVPTKQMFLPWATMSRTK
ncbi:hypothetical protein D3C86_1086040 [compost metagenome]